MGRRVVTGDVLVEDGVITSVSPRSSRLVGDVIEAEGQICMPGVIDLRVVARAEPRPGEPEDLESVSCAGVSAGVTSILGMPSPTATLAALHKKLSVASESCRANFGCYVGLTPLETEAAQQATGIAGIVVSWRETPTAQRLLAFESARRVVVKDVVLPGERVEETLAGIAGLAAKHGVLLHVLGVQAEHLAFFQSDPSPRLSGSVDLRALASDEARGQRDALWDALRNDDRLTITSGHGVLDGECALPGIEWLLPLVGDRAASGACPWPMVARWLSSGPARIFGIPRKGKIEVGYDADLALLDVDRLRVLGESAISRIGPCPYAGRSTAVLPVTTIVGGRVAYRDGRLVPDVRGRAVSFD